VSIQPVFGVQTWALPLNKQRIGSKGREECIISRVLVTGVAWLVIISVLFSGEIPQKIVIAVITGQDKQVIFA
jgi:hypothetical protein